MVKTPALARFEHTCTIRRRGAGTGSGGNARGAWDDIFTTRCRLVPLQGTEQVDAGLAVDRLYADVTLRHGTLANAITAADRILIDGVEYRIDSVIPADRVYRFVRLRVSVGLGG